MYRQSTLSLGCKLLVVCKLLDLGHAGLEHAELGQRYWDTRYWDIRNWDSGTGTRTTGTAGLGHAELGQRYWDTCYWDSFVIVFSMVCNCKDAKDCDVCGVCVG